MIKVYRYVVTLSTLLHITFALTRYHLAVDGGQFAGFSTSLLFPFVIFCSGMRGPPFISVATPLVGVLSVQPLIRAGSIGWTPTRGVATDDSSRIAPCVQGPLRVCRRRCNRHSARSQYRPLQTNCRERRQLFPRRAAFPQTLRPTCRWKRCWGRRKKLRAAHRQA